MLTRADTTIDAVDGQYEYSLAAVTGLVAVVEVWYPYLSTDDSYKLPHPVKWRMLTDSALYLDIDQDPDDAYDLRVFYDKVQTLVDLDGATTTTLQDAEKSALVIGAAGYAAIAKARDLANEVTIGADVVNQMEAWGRARLDAFTAAIDKLAALANADEDSRIGWWEVDKWDEGDG